MEALDELGLWLSPVILKPLVRLKKLSHWLNVLSVDPEKTTRAELVKQKKETVELTGRVSQMEKILEKLGYLEELKEKMHS